MANIMRCRWILTWKEVDPKDNPKGESQKPKARLVVLGFEDPLVDEIPRDRTIPDVAAPNSIKQ